MSVDPILGEQSPLDLMKMEPRLLATTSYGYVFENPVGLIDPDGRCPLTCIINIAKEIFDSSGITFSSDLTFSAGGQVAGEVEAFGAKVGFEANLISVDLLSVKTDGLDIQTTGLTSENRLQRQSFSLGIGAGIEEQKNVTISKGNGGLSKFLDANVTKSTFLGFGEFGSTRTSQDSNNTIFTGLNFGFNAAFGIGFRASFSISLEVKDQEASRIIINNRKLN